MLTALRAAAEGQIAFANLAAWMNPSSTRARSSAKWIRRRRRTRCLTIN